MVTIFVIVYGFDRFHQLTYGRIPDLDVLLDKLRLMIYGDDHAATVHPDLKEFNMLILSQFAKEIGFTITDPRKDREQRPFAPKEEFIFLQRGRVKDPATGYWFAPLPAETIRTMPCYLPKKQDRIKAMQSICQSALLEWFHHGKEIYEKEIARLNGFLQRFGYKRVYAHYEAIHAKWLSGGLDVFEDHPDPVVEFEHQFEPIKPTLHNAILPSQLLVAQGPTADIRGEVVAMAKPMGSYISDVVLAQHQATTENDDDWSKDHWDLILSCFNGTPIFETKVYDSYHGHF
jgi:hypothetical protein